MPDIDTTFGDDVLLLGKQVVWGTMMLLDDFGSVEGASVKRTGDKKEIEDGAGNLLAFLLTKVRFELTFDTIFDATVDAPGPMEIIAFPFVGVNGRVIDSEIKWEKGKERMLSIQATHWDALAAAVAYKLDPITGVYTSLDA
jgi:hypothetical protein